ncbi:hypothetical protein POM88_034894 [Heracleum sosnowskyi]|uniref:Replication protein A 70 kDa DNA-binding subunit B/D first OB fold domain-containing protein n=1 Tax=Heracleum sosnowskyi TaxID=360622 RepID=A0AAD8HMA6_9APIA|nr:hypothetical protein POM88_034894 [Heracleum sosnowskyi]
MTLNKYDVLSSLDTNTYNWNCRVRAQTIWKGISRETKKCFGINIIFLDDSNNRIQAFINQKFLEKLKEDIVEGEIYALSNFKVKHYVGDETYHAVRIDKHIYFTEHTNCVKDNSQGLQIEPYGFDLFALEEIEKSASDNRFLIDVGGIVQNYRPIVSTIKNDVETRRLIFDITDGRSFVKVTLFNEFGEQYEAALAPKKNEAIVIIMSAAKIHFYDGKVNLTNYPATRLYANPHHYSVEYMKKRPMLEVSSDEEEEETNIISVADLKSLGNDFIQKRVSVEITVKRLNEKENWTIPHPDKRFRVLTLCSDLSGCIAITFPDAEVCIIIDKSVFDIHADYTEVLYETSLTLFSIQFAFNEF